MQGYALENRPVHNKASPVSEEGTRSIFEEQSSCLPVDLGSYIPVHHGASLIGQTIEIFVRISADEEVSIPGVKQNIGEIVRVGIVRKPVPARHRNHSQSQRPLHLLGA